MHPKTILPLVLFACVSAEPSVLPTEQAPPPLTLTVGDIIPGEPLTITVDGANPGDDVVLMRGSGLGFDGCPPNLAGACVLLTNPADLALGIADTDGSWSWTVRVPYTLQPGAFVGLQAFALGVGVPGVASDPTYERIQLPGGEQDCDNLADDDFDGLADCADSDCDGIGACAPAYCEVPTCCYHDAVGVQIPGVATGTLDLFDYIDGPAGPGVPYDDVEFAGEAGDQLLLEVQADIPVTVHLQDENCDTIGVIDAAIGVFVTPINLPYTGVYTLAVSPFLPGDSGNYAIRLESLDDDGPEPPPVGQRCFDNDSVIEVDTYVYDVLNAGSQSMGGPLGDGYLFGDHEFEALAGELVEFEIEDANNDLRLFLHDEDCNVIEQYINGNEDGFWVAEIPEDGTYTLTAGTNAPYTDSSHAIHRRETERCDDPTQVGDCCHIGGSALYYDDLRERQFHGWGPVGGPFYEYQVYTPWEFYAPDATVLDVSVISEVGTEVIMFDSRCQEIARWHDGGGIVDDDIFLPEDGVYSIYVGRLSQNDSVYAEYAIQVSPR